jgi:pimeloyl-ACP methyl ester carboxylesterase
MSMDRPGHPTTAHAAARRWRNEATVAWLRLAIGFGIALVGMLAVANWFSDTSWCWLLWVAVGLATGVVVGPARRIWLVGVAALAFYPVATWLGMPRLDVVLLYWVLLTLVGAVLVGSGFVIGTAVRRRRPRPLIGGIALALLAVGGWAAYAGVVGSDEVLGLTGKGTRCDTPASRFGWKYDAINYDKADDARLVAANPDPERCTSQGSPAGAEVVTSDGVPIAGWYIPAANGAGPEGPTLLIAPGRKSDKSDTLKYAPPFHETFNLVLVDLRNGGRSGDASTTWGYLERLDVRAMVDWLVRTKDPSWIGAMGNSAGAASVLAAAAEDPRIEALILDSMHASIVTTLADGIESENHVPGYPTAWAIGAMTSARIRADLTVADPVRTITQLGDRPVLLLHGTADSVDRPEHSADRTFSAAQAAGVPVELHYCEGATHGRVIDTCPAAWAAWVDAFLGPLVESGG